MTTPALQFRIVWTTKATGSCGVWSRHKTLAATLKEFASMSVDPWVIERQASAPRVEEFKDGAWSTV